MKVKVHKFGSEDDAWDEGEVEHVACLCQEEASAIKDLVQTI